MEATSNKQKLRLNELANDFFLHLQNTAKKKINYTAKSKRIILELSSYFSEVEPLLDLKKGIFLYGPVGSGKTTMMQAFSTWKHTKKKFTITSTRDIQWKFTKEGYDVLVMHSTHSYEYKQNGYSRDNRPLIYCYDDFGAEGKSKHFGNDCLVIEEILQDRYREMQLTGMLTHVTSNLGKDWSLIEEIYGTRIRSRCREMFNIIELNMEDNRK